MVRRTKDCPNCEHSFSYDEAAGTGPKEFMTDGACPECGHYISSPPGA